MQGGNESNLDRATEAIGREPIPDGPPDSVRQFVLGLGAGGAKQVQPVTGNAGGPVEVVHIGSREADRRSWFRLAAIAASLLVLVDVGWLFYVHHATPVGWMRLETNDALVRLYDNSTTSEGPRGDVPTIAE